MTDQEPDESSIRVFGVEDPDERSLFRKSSELKVGRGDVPLSVLRERVERFVDSMQQVLSGLPHQVGGYHLQQVSLATEISAKGQVSLLGSGGEIAGKAGLTFTFVRDGTGSLVPAASPSSSDDDPDEDPPDGSEPAPQP